MRDRPSLPELLRLLAAAGLIDGKVFVRDDAGCALEVQAEAPTVETGGPRRRRHLVSV